MTAPRFFIPEPDEHLDEALRTGNETALPAKAAHHAGRALRLRIGETVTLFNGNGREWAGEIRFEASGAYVRITSVTDPGRESPVEMTLVQALVAPEKLDWIIEKAVETGIRRIVLTPAQRSVTRLSGERLAKRIQKCRDIAVSAAEQCGRNVVPEISAAPSFKSAMSDTKADLRLMMAPGAARSDTLTKVPRSAAFAVGPEGGYSDEEIELSRELGWQPFLLGPRVLRTETAGLVAAVWLNTLFGDFPKA